MISELRRIVKSSMDRWVRDRFIARFEEVDEGKWRVLRASPYLAFREKDGIVPRRAGPTRFSGPSPFPFKGLRTNRGRSDSFADSK